MRRDGKSFFVNQLEAQAVYCLVRGGEYKYSATQEVLSIPDLYFSRHTVTNRRYRQFIAFLAGTPDRNLSLEKFSRELLARASGNLVKHLGGDVEQWADKLRSMFDTDARFNAEEQPVVGVSWFGAITYCRWLTDLHEATQIEPKLFRLPTEPEWEWAATGGVRKFPWGNQKPNEDYLCEERARSPYPAPVGSFPKGTTPEGLYEMAGNAWEWCENPYDEQAPFTRALRGGTTFITVENPLCSFARANLRPDACAHLVSFRVVSENFVVV